MPNESTQNKPEDALIYFQIIDNSATPTLALDQNHKLIIWNKACEKLTGYKADDLIGTDNHWQPFYGSKRPTMADLVIDGNTSDAKELYETYKVENYFSEGGLQGEGWYPNLGGVDRYIFFKAVPIKNEKGEIIAAVETIEDITERRLADENNLKELKEKVAQLGNIDSLIVNREQKMAELKKEIEFLKKMINQ